MVFSLLNVSFFIRTRHHYVGSIIVYLGRRSILGSFSGVSFRRTRTLLHYRTPLLAIPRPFCTTAPAPPLLPPRLGLLLPHPVLLSGLK